MSTDTEERSAKMSAFVHGSTNALIIAGVIFQASDARRMESIRLIVHFDIYKSNYLHRSGLPVLWTSWEPPSGKPRVVITLARHENKMIPLKMDIDEISADQLDSIFNS